MEEKKEMNEDKKNIKYVSFSEVDENANFVDVYGYYEENNINEILKEMQEMEKKEKTEKEG